MERNDGASTKAPAGSAGGLLTSRLVARAAGGLTGLAALLLPTMSFRFRDPRGLGDERSIECFEEATSSSLAAGGGYFPDSSAVRCTALITITKRSLSKDRLLNYLAARVKENGKKNLRKERLCVGNVAECSSNIAKDIDASQQPDGQNCAIYTPRTVKAWALTNSSFSAHSKPLLLFLGRDVKRAVVPTNPLDERAKQRLREKCATELVSSVFEKWK